MKKYFIALLALVMLLTLSVPALAEVTPAGSTEQDVTAGYTAAKDTDGGTVYRVTIDWQANAGSEALSYTGKQSTYTWDTTGLQYKEEVDEQAGWKGETGYTVTVTNYSNAEVDASVNATVNYNLTLEAPGTTSAKLGSAAVDSQGNAFTYTDTDKVGTVQNTTFTYTYKANASADAPDGASSSVSVGKITVTVTTGN